MQLISHLMSVISPYPSFSLSRAIYLGLPPKSPSTFRLPPGLIPTVPARISMCGNYCPVPKVGALVGEAVAIRPVHGPVKTQPNLGTGP
jgi:hypothetical protein